MSATPTPSFRDVVETPEEVAEILGDPGATQHKLIDVLDEHCQAFIARSPFMVMSTVDPTGHCDASPRGGAPGWVEVLDEHRLVIPDAFGNKLGDSLRNIASTGQIGLLFLIPGMGETLRVNGRAVVTQDPELLDRHVTQGKRPTLAIGVEVELAFLHCAKAFIRSKLWNPDSWGEREGMARPAQIWSDHIALPDVTVQAVDELLDHAYVNELY